LGGQQRFNNILSRLIGSGSSDHWVVEDGQRLVALLDVEPGVFKKPHHLRLIVHPDWRGQLETLLIGQALDYLYPWRHRSMVLRHPSEHREAVTAFQYFGFKEDQTLLWMKREM
jgi:GNAT superfamily N-acetyltransferase